MLSTAIRVQQEFPRLALAGIVVIGAGGLIVAWFGEHVFAIEPCILCLYQRIPYAIVAALAATTALLPLSSKHRRGAIAICSLVFIAGSVLAFYSVGVEEHWWASVPGCSVPTEPQTVSAEDFLASLS